MRPIAGLIGQTWIRESFSKGRETLNPSSARVIKERLGLPQRALIGIFGIQSARFSLKSSLKASRRDSDIKASSG